MIPFIIQRKTDKKEYIVLDSQCGTDSHYWYMVAPRDGGRMFDVTSDDLAREYTYKGQAPIWIHPLR